jgi:hypothetical protein
MKKPDSTFTMTMPVAGGDPLNDLAYYDEESEARQDYFGRGQNNRGCAPAPVYNRKTSGIASPITGAAMGAVGSFGELCGK